MMHTKCFSIRPDVLHETIDNEAIIVNLINGSYYSLDQIGGLIWELIGQYTTLSQIVDSVADHYQGDRVDIERAVSDFLDELEKEGLIVPAKVKQGSGINKPSGVVSEGVKPKFEKPVLQTYTDMKELFLLDPIHEVDETGWPNRVTMPSKKE